MADLLRTHPLESWTDALAAVGISVEPYVPMFDVRGSSDMPPNTWTDMDGGRVVWLGPDQRLFIGVSPGEGSITDVSAQRIILRLTAREVLAKGCSIDLHPSVFGSGHSAQTTLGQAGVILLSLGSSGDDFLVLVRSSFAGYLAEWLLDASR